MILDTLIGKIEELGFTVDLDFPADEKGVFWLDLNNGMSIQIQEGKGYGVHYASNDPGFGEKPHATFHSHEALIRDLKNWLL
jgi:hypothetical protein